MRDLTVAHEAPRGDPAVERTPDPCVMVIFGASGDLTQRKLMPALYQLARQQLLPREFSVVGFARSPMSDEAFRDKMKKAVAEFSRTGPLDMTVWDRFARSLRYLSAEYRDSSSYRGLAELLATLDRERGTQGNRVFYLAVPPSSYDGIVRQLGAAGLARTARPSWTRIIVEKPFGRDLETGRTLNRTLREIFAEEQIYRIDHYLGKETVQNILVFRLASGIFEPIWNRRYIDHVQITVAESLGVEGRGAYYEEAGVIRDMVQNHLLQLLCLVAMEPPIGWQPRSIRDEKLKVLQAICPLTPESVAECAVRGQYGPGVIDGEPVVAYRGEPGVKPDSTTETYAAVKFCLETWRWADVPFYLRSGKRLPRRITEIAIQFKQPPLRLFRQVTQEPLDPSVLALQIQPAEGISLTVGTKVPGPVIRIQPVTMEFRYEHTFGKETPEAYERLLLDCLQGDPTLFARGDWVEEAWALVMPILDAWQNGLSPSFPNYAAGMWGPPEAEALMARDGRRWR